MPNKKQKPACRYCGSDKIIADAAAVWSTETDQWELIDTFDSYCCRDCEEVAKFADWVNI